MPVDEDAIFCRKPIRSAKMEARVHDAISMYFFFCNLTAPPALTHFVSLYRILPCFEIRSSGWNHSRPTNMCAFELRLHQPGRVIVFSRVLGISLLIVCPSQYGDDSELGWFSIVADDEKFCVVEPKERVHRDAPAEVSHSSLRRVLLSYFGRRAQQNQDEQRAEELELVERCLKTSDNQTLAFQLACNYVMNLLRLFTFH